MAGGEVDSRQITIGNVSYGELEEHFEMPGNGLALWKEFTEICQVAGLLDQNGTLQQESCNGIHTHLQIQKTISSGIRSGNGWPSKLKKYTKSLRVTLDKALRSKDNGFFQVVSPGAVEAAYLFAFNSAEQAVSYRSNPNYQSGAVGRNEVHLYNDASRIGHRYGDYLRFLVSSHQKKGDFVSAADYTALADSWYEKSIAAAGRGLELAKKIDDPIDEYNLAMEMFDSAENRLSLALGHTGMTQENAAVVVSHSISMGDYITSAYYCRVTHEDQFRKDAGLVGFRVVDEADGFDSQLLANAMERYNRINKYLATNVGDVITRVTDTVNSVAKVLLDLITQYRTNEMPLYTFSPLREAYVRSIMPYLRMIAVIETDILQYRAEDEAADTDKNSVFMKQELRKFILSSIANIQESLATLNGYKSMALSISMDEREILYGDLKRFINAMEKYRHDSFPDTQPKFYYSTTLLSIIKNELGIDPDKGKKKKKR